MELWKQFEIYRRPSCFIRLKGYGLRSSLTDRHTDPSGWDALVLDDLSWTAWRVTRWSDPLKWLPPGLHVLILKPWKAVVATLLSCRLCECPESWDSILTRPQTSLEFLWELTCKFLWTRLFIFPWCKRTGIRLCCYINSHVLLGISSWAIWLLSTSGAGSRRRTMKNSLIQLMFIEALLWHPPLSTVNS